MRSFPRSAHPPIGGLLRIARVAPPCIEAALQRELLGARQPADLSFDGAQRVFGVFITRVVEQGELELLSRFFEAAQALE